MPDLSAVLEDHGISSESLRPLSDGASEPVGYYLPLSGAEAVARWSALRNVVDQIGYWPVLLGGDADLADHVAAIADSRSGGSAQILADARGLDTEAWLRDRLAVLRQDDPAVLEDLHEAWPVDIEHDDTFSTPYDLETAGLRPTCYLGLMPARASWEVPAVLHFGSRADCPASAEHASVLARWERMYAAEIVGMTHATLELTVGHPPSEREQALALAYEQLAYCPNVVVQGTLTIERLAATLLNGRVWFFGWT